ncbi:MAG: DNA-3-methyladenine glycosylase family protein, partial [Nocardioidaceae bacterium]
LELRLAVRRPYAAADLLGFLGARAVPGVEECTAGQYARTLRLPHGHGLARLSFADADQAGVVGCSLELSDLRDLAAAVERCRRLVDGDCDPEAVDAHLGAHHLLAPLVRARPGLRVPGQVDGDEVAVRAVLGQQVSVAGARRLAELLVHRYGDRLPDGRGMLFPSAATLADVAPADLPMPRARGRALTALCAALASGHIVLDRGADRSDVRRALLAVPGIGPWTADYIAMRALGDPDVFLSGDVGVRHAFVGLGLDPASAAVVSQEWRPWRSYAQMHVWSTLPTGSNRTREK